jgi:hypothetical protein
MKSGVGDFGIRGIAGATMRFGGHGQLSTCAVEPSLRDGEMRGASAS